MIKAPRQNQLLGNLGDALALIHRRLAQQRIGGLFVNAARLHQDGFRSVDDLAFLKRGSGRRQFGAHALEHVKPRDGGIQHRLDAVRPQPVHDIGRDPRLDRRPGQMLVRAVDEHRHRPLCRPRGQRQFLKDIARGIGQIDQHDVGPAFGDMARKAGFLGKDADIVIADLAQTVHDGGGAFGVRFDDDDGKALVHGIPLLVMAGVPSRQAMPQCGNAPAATSNRCPCAGIGQKRRPAPNRWAGVPPDGQSLHRTASDHSAGRNSPDLPGYSAPRLFRSNCRAWRWFCAAAPPLAGAMPPLAP